MKVLLKEMRLSKIDAIKRLRYMVSYLDLRTAKNVCESLPFEIEVDGKYIDDLDISFKYEVVGVSVTEDQLRAKWNALLPQRQLLLLQMLDADRRLD